MWNIKVKTGYRDYSPAITKVNGAKPITEKDDSGAEYFNANKGDLLTVPSERGTYLVKERKLADLVSIEQEVAIKKPANKETADIKPITKPKKANNKK